MMQKLLMVLVITGLVLAYFVRTDIKVVDNNIVPSNHEEKIIPHKHGTSHATHPTAHAPIKSQPTQPISHAKTGNAHFDQLSPEMKKALSEKLLFNAPIETIERPDGTVILKTNGRVTHMPVAVQMPDGSIQIKENSYIPKAK